MENGLCLIGLPKKNGHIGQVYFNRDAEYLWEGSKNDTLANTDFFNARLAIL